MKKIVNKLQYFLIYAATTIVCLCLGFILIWVFSNGASLIDFEFLSTDTKEKSVYVYFEEGEKYDFTYSALTDSDGDTVLKVDTVTSQGNLFNNSQEKVTLVNGTVIEEVAEQDIEDLTAPEAEIIVKELRNPVSKIKVKLTIPGGGIYPLILTTIFIVFFSLIIAIPFGLFAAIYLVEYDVNPKINKLVHFAIDSLAGIPSIIFGLFGAIFFSRTLGMGQSVLAGILTVSIMLLPIVIKAIEESLMSVPDSFREASYGLGATKSQTLFKVIIPSALPGIMVAVILSIGRVIGESAIFVFVIGTTPALPSFMGKGATLTVYAYNITRETPNFEMAAAIGVVVIVIILFLNIFAKLISRKIGK